MRERRQGQRPGSGSRDSLLVWGGRRLAEGALSEGSGGPKAGSLWGTEHAHLGQCLALHPGPGEGADRETPLHSH